MCVCVCVVCVCLCCVCVFNLIFIGKVYLFAIGFSINAPMHGNI